MNAVKNAPATPLPWTEREVGIYVGTQGDESLHTIFGGGSVAEYLKAQDADYIVRVANAYPRMVAALRNYLAADAEALLRELGEA